MKFSLFFILVFSLGQLVLSLSTVQFANVTYPGNTYPYANLDGTGGNPGNPSAGRSGELLSYFTNTWADQAGSMATDLPNPREVSNQLFAYGTRNYSVSLVQLSNLHPTFGQFVMRDIIEFDKTTSTEAANIKVPQCDRFFDPGCLGTATLSFKRLNPTIQNGKRNYANKATIWLDLSQVYGSSVSQNAQYRTGSGGKLKVSADGSTLPQNIEAITLNGIMNDTRFYLSADPRLNQDLSLVAWSTLYTLRHNSLADQIYKTTDKRDDDELFYEARRRNIAEYQSIVFNEYLSNLLFDQPITSFNRTGRGPSLTPEFIMAANFGHHTIPSFFSRMLSTAVSSTHGPLLLRDNFWNKKPNISRVDIQELFVGFLTDVAKQPDSVMIDDLRNFFYNPTGVTTDLAAMAIQRGRDIGAPYYNQMRRRLGYPAVQKISEICLNSDLAARATLLYPDIEKLDLYVGLVLEDAVEGQSIQSTTEGILRSQLSDIFSSDIFFYQNQWRTSTISRLNVAELDNFKVSSLLKAQFPDISLYVQNRGFLLPVRSSFSNVSVAPVDPNYDVVKVFDESYFMYWKFFNQDQIKIKIQVKGSGWVGLGLNPQDNKMKNMPVIIGRVLKDSGIADVGVFFSVDVGYIPDSYPNITLRDISGSHVEGNIIIQFSMPVKTNLWNLFPPGQKAGYSCSFAFNSYADDLVFHGPSRGNSLVFWENKNFTVALFMNARNPFIDQYKLAVNTAIADFFKYPLPYGETIRLQPLWIDTNGSQALAVSQILNVSESNNNLVAFIGGETVEDTTAVSYVLLNNKNVQLSPFVRDDDIATSNTSFLFRTTNKYSTQTYALVHAIDQSERWKEVAVLYSPDQYEAFLEFRDYLSSPRETASNVISINYTMTVDNSNLDYRLANLQASRTAILVALISSSYWHLLLNTNSSAAGFFQKPYVWLCSDGLLDAIDKGIVELDDPRLNGFITVKEVPQNQTLIRERLGIPAKATVDYATGHLYDTIGALSAAIRQLILKNQSPLDGPSLKTELQNAYFDRTTDQDANSRGTGFDILLFDSYSFDQRNQLGACNYEIKNIFNASLLSASMFSCAATDLGNWTYYYSDGSTTAPRSDIPPNPKDIFYVKWSDGVAIVIIALTCLALVIHFVILIGLVVYRNERVIKSSSSLFLFLIWTGMLIGYCFNFVWTAEPSSFICNFRPWFASVGFCLMYGSLLLKAYRNWTVVGLSDVTKIASFSNSKLAPYIAALWSIYAIMLIVWVAYDPLYVDPAGPNKSDNTVTRRCYSDHHTGFVIALMTYTAIILGAGLFFAYKSRNNKGEYSESRWVSLTIFNFTLTAVSVIPVTFALYNIPLIAYLVLGFGLIWINIITTITFFIPKMFYIYENAGDGRWQENRSTRRGTL